VKRIVATPMHQDYYEMKKAPSLNGNKGGLGVGLGVGVGGEVAKPKAESLSFIKLKTTHRVSVIAQGFVRPDNTSCQIKNRHLSFARGF